MLELLLDAAACFRITRLVVADGITQPLRGPLLKWATERVTVTVDLEPTQDFPNEGRQREVKRERHPKLAELIECPWCVSIYAATGIVALRRFAPRAWQPLATVLALSAAAGYISTQLEE